MLSDATRDVANVARGVVSAEERDDEIDVEDSNGKTGLVSSSGRRKNRWLKFPSRVCHTNASPNEIYLLVKILESSGSMF